MIKFLNLLFFAGLLFLSGCERFSHFGCSHDHGHEHGPAKEASAEQQAPQAFVDIASEDDFEQKVLKASKPVIVDFTAKWCGACQDMKPVFAELASELKDKYTFAVVNVDVTESIAKNLKIQGLPAFLLFQNGKEVNAEDRMFGVISKDTFKKNLEESFE